MTMVKCAVCGKEKEIWDMHYDRVNDTFVCKECWALYLLEHDNLVICHDCGDLIDKSDAVEFEGKIYCDSCCHDLDLVECDYCGELVRRDDLHHIDYTNVDVCDSCYDEHFSECSCCGEIVNNEYIHYWSDTDEWLCPDCWEAHEREEEEESESSTYYIRGYHAGNPDGIQFYGKGPCYFGMEIEIDEGGEDDENAGILLEKIGGYEHAHCEHDGSLNEGLEFITQPMSYNYFHHDFRTYLEAFAEKATKLGYTAHNAETCGLHIHVSRNAFSDESIERLWTLFYKFKNEMLTFSRRKPDQLRFCELPTKKNIAKTYTPGGNRYQALNLNNSTTIEFRLWRGSLNVKTILATLEFTNAICTWALNHSMEELDSVTWEDFVTQILNENETEYLRDYLVVRKLYFPEVNEELNVTLGDLLAAAD